MKKDKMLIEAMRVHRLVYDETIDEVENTGSAYLLSASIYPSLSIGILDTATDLQSVRPRGESLLGRLVIPRSQHDHMSATKIVLLVEIRIVRSAVLRGEIRLQIGGCGREGATYDLLDRSGVQVNAGAEFGHFCRFDYCYMLSQEVPGSCPVPT